MKNAFISILLLLIVTFSHAQLSTIKSTLEWSDPVEFQVTKTSYSVQHTFKDAHFTDVHPTLPIYLQQVKVPGYGTLQASLVNSEFEPITNTDGLDDNYITSTINIKAEIHISKKKAVGGVSFIPIRKNSITGGYERLLSFEIELKHTPAPILSSNKGPTATDSELRHGDIYKLAIGTSGMYKLSYNYLKNTLGIDVDNIDPRKIKIFGNGGGMLPEPNASPRIDDLKENAIHVEGEGDGKFNTNDFVLFYAQDANVWKYLPGSSSYSRETNIYSDSNFYFLRILDSDGTNGIRIQNQQSIGSTAYTTSEFDGLAHHEEDLQNLLDYSSSAHGSGKRWVGKSFKVNTSQDFSFLFPNLVNNEPVVMRSYINARATNSGAHQMIFSSNNTAFHTENCSLVSTNPEGPYTDTSNIVSSFMPSSENITINMEYIKPTSSSEAWLDYMTLIGRRQLRYTGTPLHFRDKNTIGKTTATYNLSNANNNVIIWDITDPLTPAKQQVSNSGNVQSFGVNVNSLGEFIAFEQSQAGEPTFIEKIQNQNLHNLPVPDMLVIYHESLKPAVDRFVDHRSSHSNLTIHAVEISKVYNEFGSGKADVTAIRDFVKMFYDRSVPGGDEIKYLLLFGGASFDFRNINDEPSATSLVPTFQTYESNNTVFAFPTDDYFTLLDELEGGTLASGSEDISVGRFPGRTLVELNGIVDKIIHYDTDVETLSDWRNRLLFIADDEDTNVHFKDADGIAESTRLAYPKFNLEKVYFDAFNQITSPGGNRYPEVNQSISRNVDFKGSMVVNYMGHGGPSSWAQERVLTIDDIDLWNNFNKMALFVTATCSFGPYDDYKEENAGENLILNPDGGAVGLFTTVRAVYASTNQRLTKAVFDELFEPINGKQPTIGEVMKLAKNSLVTAQSKLNSRKFALLGDPSMRLAIPKYDVRTTMINGQPVSPNDTIRAKQQVVIQGIVVDQNGNLASDFNGVLAPTVFDKAKSIKTLVNDPKSKLDSFNLQKNVIFKGLASVVDGKFEFDFVVPVDIEYTYGNGKISYYAHDPSTLIDASGYHDTLVIGGTALNGVADNSPPEVEVYMNNEDFVFGGITDENPVLYVKLSDDLGINTTGTSVGHDITGVLDERTKDIYVLNDFYEATLDNSREGIVKYPLSSLEEGLHSITVKAWDISNNPGEDFTEFVVARSSELAINHVLNYPNPFTTSTNFQFEHNLPGTMFNVQVQIYTISGRLLKTIDETVISDGYRVSDIHWDGKDDFGDHIGKGVYVYKVQIAAENGEQEVRVSNSAFEKLVILK